MKFRKIEHYINLDTNKVVPFGNKRIEYFHQYWIYLFQKDPPMLFSEDEKFESHRSLFLKINLQLEHNPKHYAKQIDLQFIKHPYFYTNNILIKRNKDLKNKITNFNNYFCQVFSNKNEKICQNELNNVKNHLNGIEAILLKSNYLKRVLNHLISLLHKDKELNSQFKSDIKFLINAVIIELYYYGYSLDYIKNIPDYILFPNQHIEQFPYDFDKKYTDFSDYEDYRSYKENEIKKLNLATQIKSLLNLINRPKNKGYYIFKIDDFELQQAEPITIGNVTFYNPQLCKKLKYSTTPNKWHDNQWKEYVEEIEIYFEGFVKNEEKQQKKSACNAIIEVEYRPLFWNKPDNSYNNTRKLVERSLQVLKSLSYIITGYIPFQAAINPSKYILTGRDLEYRQAPDKKIKIDSTLNIKGEQKDTFKRILKSVNKPNPNNEFHYKLIKIYAYLKQFIVEPESFNFKDSWTIISESLFPNNPEGFIRFCKKCYRYSLNYRLLNDVKYFLGKSLKHDPFDWIGSYSIDTDILKNSTYLFQDTFQLRHENLKRIMLIS